MSLCGLGHEQSSIIWTMSHQPTSFVAYSSGNDGFAPCSMTSVLRLLFIWSINWWCRFWICPHSSRSAPVVNCWFFPLRCSVHQRFLSFPGHSESMHWLFLIFVQCFSSPQISFHTQLSGLYVDVSFFRMYFIWFAWGKLLLGSRQKVHACHVNVQKSRLLAFDTYIRRQLTPSGGRRGCKRHSRLSIVHLTGQMWPKPTSYQVSSDWGGYVDEYVFPYKKIQLPWLDIQTVGLLILLFQIWHEQKVFCSVLFNLTICRCHHHSNMTTILEMLISSLAREQCLAVGNVQSCRHF